MEELPGEVDGDLDVDLAELSLGQRLTALSGVEDMAHRPPSSNSENEGHPKAPMEKRGKHENRGDTAIPTVPANSLTRTLIQALHSSDTRLLETCLTHSDHALIHSTVRRLPPQLAVPLLTACMERLGRGARGATMKGGGGGASSQRGMTLVAWIKAVLLIHNGHLMTVRNLRCIVRSLAHMHHLDARSCCAVIWITCDADHKACPPGKFTVIKWATGHAFVAN
jgi:U3 small nucleolar RNA-associated protein 5